MLKILSLKLRIPAVKLVSFKNILREATHCMPVWFYFFYLSQEEDTFLPLKEVKPDTTRIYLKFVFTIVCSLIISKSTADIH